MDNSQIDNTLTDNFHKLLFHDSNAPVSENGVTESVWAIQVGDNAYQVQNIPFFISSVACGDIFSAREIEGELWGDQLMKESGNSTIQVFFYEAADAEVTAELMNQKFGADWEGGHSETLISVSIPSTADYKQVRAFLMEGHEQEKWDFREACLSGKHDADLEN